MERSSTQNIDVFRTRHILNLAAQAYAQATRQIPKEKISRRIEELKYLTAQKKIPRLSLRKEILHLEEQLHSILHVETVLLKKEKHESERIAQLKKQNEQLRKQLAAAGDGELRQKVNKLSRLLADALAHRETKRTVAAVQKKQPITPPVAHETAQLEVSQQGLPELEQRVEKLKELVEQRKATGASEELLLLEERIAQLEEKIKQRTEEKPQVRHRLLFGQSSTTSSSLPAPSLPTRKPTSLSP
ncbi:hypothetical protein HY496_00775 [Candidatus Woesearchaeota archaeon]|nr:hypothetical protein [Candidatus Woesearchaeota archaeon]